MKKYFINEDWEPEEFEDNSNLFLLIVEQSLPACSYVHQANTSMEPLQPGFAQLINQYDTTEVDGLLRVHLVKVPNTLQINSQINCADSEHKGNTEEAIEAINNILNRADCEILESWGKEPLTEKNARKRKKHYSSITYTTGYPELNIDFFNSHFGTGEIGNNTCEDSTADSIGEVSGPSDCSESLTEAKREVKRYYVRPFNIFAANKAEILKILADHQESNCSIYSLKSLDDHDDVHLLQPSDIIYYYDEGVLYDKNHVQVLDYNLKAKAEEERKRVTNIDDSSSTFRDAYSDRMTSATDLDEFTEALTESFAEDINSCCICGEEFEGYGNNSAPVTEEGRCCDACLTKFVIPARLEAGKEL